MEAPFDVQAWGKAVGGFMIGVPVASGKMPNLLACAYLGLACDGTKPVSCRQMAQNET